MTRRRRSALSPLLALALVLTSVGAVAAARPFPDRIDLPNGWGPEGITAGPGTTVFVGSLVDGAIWQGDVRTGLGDVVIPGEVGMVAVGVFYEADADRLWVAGGGTGQVRVYDASSGDLLETYLFPLGGFLNDLVVTDDAVYITDSAVDYLAVVPLGAGDTLPDPGDVETLPLGGEFELAAGFNLNGIEEARGWLIAVQSNTGRLYRIDPDTGDARIIDLGGYSVTMGDGLEVHGGTLYVVRNFINTIAELKLGPGLETAALVDETTQDDLSVPLDVPTTAAWVAGNLYAVNARFGTPPTPAEPYWITRIPA
jgi:outer membrane protein assembly factor BamB